MKHPSIIQIDNLQRHIKANSTKILMPIERWVPVRPVGYPRFFYRFKAAWLVFTGQADALKWRGQ